MARQLTPRLGRFGLDQGQGYLTAFPAQSSVLDEEVLLSRVVKLYDVPQPTGCSFYCRGDADVYRIHTRGRFYYLKVYRPEYSPAHVESEGRLVTDLARCGVPVVPPVPLAAGGFAHAVDAPEGTRSMLLLEQAPHGTVSELDEAFSERLGASLARLHAVADRLTNDYRLPATDATTFDSLLPYAQTVLGDDDYHLLRTVADRIRPKLAGLADKPPDHGLCHCDLVRSNIRVREDGEIVFFDFGGAGFCWRAYELAVARSMLEQAVDRNAVQCWDALLAGYARVRPAPVGLSEAMPYMLLTRNIGWVAGNAATLPLRLGRQQFEQGVMAKAVGRVREIADGIPESAGLTARVAVPGEKEDV
ncbi:MAG: phosphotransferase [candidate division WOR-3 bacterium]|nr:MAG: phosphotransferase [candidate division WOR-3 bacterium]